MRYRFVIVGVLAALLSVLLPVVGPSGLVSQAYALTVSRIVIEGNQRIENDTVLSYMQISAGQPFDSVKIDESIKALFETGLFADVQIFRRGNDLVVKVEENPMINRVNFEGNEALKLGLDRLRGALVEKVYGETPAASAGLQARDVILQIETVPIKSDTHLINLVSNLPPGQRVRLLVWRDRASATLEATVGDWARVQAQAVANP